MYLFIKNSIKFICQNNSYICNEFKNKLYKMKNTKLITLFAVLFIGTIMISCGKYEEGPGISLLPKKTRLQQKWKPVQTVDAQTGIVNNLDDDGSYVEILKGGSMNYYNHALLSPWGIDAVSGTWELSEDKTQLITNYTFLTIDYPDTLTIIKLKINDLGLMDSNGDKTYYEYK